MAFKMPLERRRQGDQEKAVVIKNWENDFYPFKVGK